jgi:hypothetical protein
MCVVFLCIATRLIKGVSVDYFSWFLRMEFMEVVVMGDLADSGSLYPSMINHIYEVVCWLCLIIGISVRSLYTKNMCWYFGVLTVLRCSNQMGGCS